MKDKNRNIVASVIKANSQAVTLEQLANRGDRQFRVISWRETLSLIETIVGDAIKRGTAKVSDADREQIVAEAKDQFHRVSRIQAESQAVIGRQKELLDSQQAQIQRLEKAETDLRTQLEEERSQGGEEDSQAVRLKDQALEEAQASLRESQEQQQQAVGTIRQLNRRLANARETILNYDQEFDRFVVQIKENTVLIEQLRLELQDREHELGRVKGLMEALGEEVSTARARGDAEPGGMNDLRGELAEMKTFLKSLEGRGSQAVGPMIEAMLEKIAQKQTAGASELEDRFHSKLSDTLDKIDQSIRRATSRAIDRPIEATDVYISKIFDDDASMESNLHNLDIQATTAKQSILNSLDRLKQLRNQATRAMEENSGEGQQGEPDGL